MEKIRIMLLLWLLMVMSSVNAQLLNVRIGSDVLVENAIKDAIVIVESNYCIQDTETNQKYGRNDNPYFNVIRFLGCKTDKGVITTRKVVEPWSVDELFDKYRNDSKYRPLLDNTMIVRNLIEDKNDSINIGTNLKFNDDSTLVCSGICGSNADGLMLTADNKNSINWIVWIKQADNKSIDEEINLEYSIVKKTIDVFDGNTVIDAPNSTNTYLGALYVSGNVVSVGLVKFSLSGFITDKFGKWTIEPLNNGLFTKKEESQAEISTQENNTTEDNLTPMKEKKKKQQRKNKKK